MNTHVLSTCHVARGQALPFCGHWWPCHFDISDEAGINLSVSGDLPAECGDVFSTAYIS